jgi:hypothetical protein
MSLIGKTVEEQMWNFYMARVGNAYGVAALMGHWFAESGLNPKNLQNSFEKKLGYTDESYTKAVDDGSYGNFVRDSAGYGLAQWTYWSRKQNMLRFARQRGCSIGDTEMQFEFGYQELCTGYKGVLAVMKSAKSVREASDVLLTQYERPADQSEAVKVKRAGYGQKYYEKYAGSSGKPKQEGSNMGYSRQKVVDLVNSWIGKKEADGSYKSIIDIYNTQKSFPRGTRMQYGWAWCACTWSALAVKLGYTAIMPVEISCYYLVEQAKKMGVWVENDGYVPQPGDAVLYDWQDSGAGDNTGAPDHVGTVTEVYPSAGYFVVVEGNYSNQVKKRTVSINGKYIRGFIAPKYSDNVVKPATSSGNKDVITLAREVIAGAWGTGAARKTKLTAAGYDYATVQAKVNEILNGSAAKPKTETQNQSQPTEKKVTATESAYKYDKGVAGSYKTTANLYIRNGAGSNKKALALIPKGTSVNCYGYYNVANGAKWLYIQVAIDGVLYTGFSHAGYLKK